MLFVAMLTTEATVGLAVVSHPDPAILGLAIAIGIALSWCVSRVLLEPVYLRQRRPRTSESSRHRSSIHSALEGRAWSGLLMMLALLVLLAPPGVTVASVESFLPADSPSIDALQDLEARYLVAATAPILIVADADPEDPDVIDRLRGFEVGSRRILRSSPWTRDWSVVRSSRGYRQMNHERMTRWMPGSNGAWQPRTWRIPGSSRKDEPRASRSKSSSTAGTQTARSNSVRTSSTSSRRWASRASSVVISTWERSPPHNSNRPESFRSSSQVDWSRWWHRRCCNRP